MFHIAQSDIYSQSSSARAVPDVSWNAKVVRSVVCRRAAWRLEGSRFVATFWQAGVYANNIPELFATTSCARTPSRPLSNLRWKLW